MSVRAGGREGAIAEVIGLTSSRSPGELRGQRGSGAARRSIGALAALVLLLLGP